MLISYTHSYTHFMCSSTYPFTYTFHVLIHIFIRIYSFINSFKYTHSCILIHNYYHLLSFLVMCDNNRISPHYVFITYCLSCSNSCFNSFSFSFSIIIFMFHEHINTLFIFYIFLVSCLLHMALHILVKYDVYEITPHSYILIPL